MVDVTSTFERVVNAIFLFKMKITRACGSLCRVVPFASTIAKCVTQRLNDQDIGSKEDLLSLFMNCKVHPLSTRDCTHELTVDKIATALF